MMASSIDHGGPSDRDFLSSVAAAALAVAAALWIPLAQGVTVTLAAAVVSLPVWIGALRAFRFGRTVLIVGVLAVTWGVALTLVDTQREVSMDLMRGHTLNLLAFIGSIGMLLWSRSHIGVSRTAMWFGVGLLAMIPLSGVDGSNPWKFTFALPVAITVLGVVGLKGSRWGEIVVLTALSAMSLISDSRSMTAFFVLAIPVVAWQIVGKERRKGARPWNVIILLSAMALAAYNLFQSLLLDGVLGEAAQQRTAMQIETSGSLIAGGRPEIGASRALLVAHPFGYGSGTLPSSTDIWTAKTGMGELGYDPNNGYVERYMFGSKFEVHSVLGDLWIRFGPFGALLVITLIGSAVYAVARLASLRECSGVVVYLLYLGAWNVLFSPAYSSFSTLALLFALTAMPIFSRAGEQSGSLAGRGQLSAGRVTAGIGKSNA